MATVVLVFSSLESGPFSKAENTAAPSVGFSAIEEHVKSRNTKSLSQKQRSPIPFPQISEVLLKHHTPLLFVMCVAWANRKGTEISQDMSSVEPSLLRQQKLEPEKTYFRVVFSFHCWDEGTWDMYQY